MNFQIVSLFPELFKTLSQDGVVGQAVKSGLLSVTVTNPREFATDRHKTVDDRPYGGGDGMLMLAEPLAQALGKIGDTGHVIYLSPQGSVLTDQKVQELAKREKITLICGRYGGVDQRFLSEHIDEEISIGDYVLSGGEYAALVLVDAVSRFVPGVLGHEDSAQADSITSGGLEAPAYTRPREWGGVSVPEILFSGHHEQIEEWRRCVGSLVTFAKRPDLFVKPKLSVKQKKQWSDWCLADAAALGIESSAVQKFIQEIET